MDNTAATKLLLWYASLFTLLFFANGLYNPLIAKCTALYWSIDLLTWIGLPGLALWHLNHRFQISPPALLRFLHFGKDLKIGWGHIPLLVILAAFIITVLRFTQLILHYSYAPDIFEPYFSYHEVLPTLPSRRETIIVYFALSAGILEEVVYRGLPYHLIDYLRNRPFLYVLSTSGIFSLLHWEQNIWGLVSTYIFGVIFATLYLKSQNIILPMILHAITNIFFFHSLTFAVIDYGFFYIFS